MTYGVQSTDRQKQIGIWIACFLLWVGFVIVSQLEGNVLLSAAGFGDEWVYMLLDDFYIPYRYGWIRGILQRLLSALPMILFGMVPMLALAFAALRKKIPALIFAGIHLLLCAIFGICAFVRIRIWSSRILSIGWLLFLTAAVLILLHVLGLLQNKKKLFLALAALAVLSGIVFCALMCFRIGGRRGLRFVGMEGFRELWHNYNSYGNIYSFFNHNVARFHPISCSLLFAAMAMGALCTVPVKKPAPAPRMAQNPRSAAPVAPQPAKWVEGKVDSTEILERLERFSKLHEEGFLTDEEFRQKKQELLAKI